MFIVYCLLFLVKFCSESCKERAYDIYHKYECRINMHFEEHFKDILITMRPFFIALYLCYDDINLLKSHFIDDPDTMQQTKTVFDYDLSSPTVKNYALNIMKVFDSYKAAENNEPFYDCIELIFSCHPILAAMWIGNEIIITKMLSRYADNLRELGHAIVQWPTNTKHLIHQLPPTTNQFQLLQTDSICKIIGVGYYSFLGLLNHSCVPNIYRHVNEFNQMILIVCRPIIKGQQLFVDYKYVQILTCEITNSNLTNIMYFF